jgi:hypothetical protein
VSGRNSGAKDSSFNEEPLSAQMMQILIPL